MRYGKPIGITSLALLIGAAALVLMENKAAPATHALESTKAVTSVAAKENTATKAPANAKALNTLSREEAIAQAEIELRAKSNFKQRTAERNQKSEAKLQAVKKIVASSTGQNAAVKQYLNVDTKQAFGIDFDAKMQEAKQKRYAEDTAVLEHNLLSQGASPYQVDQVKKFRQQVLSVSQSKENES